MNELSLADVVGRTRSQSERKSRRDLEKRRRKRRRRTLLTLAVALALIAGAMGGAWVGLRPLIATLTAPTDYPGPGGAPVEVKIPDGATGLAIGEVLQQNGVVLTVKGFVTAYKENPRSATIQPGTYALKREMTSVAAVEALLDEANRLIKRVTLKEGVRMSDVPDIVANSTGIPEAEVRAALRTPAAFGLPAGAEGNPEGWLFPATYDVAPDATATELLAEMVQRTLRELDALGVSDAEHQRMLILASMVQAEAMLPADFPKIARVIENRLSKKMKLQLDSTVHYATGRYNIATAIRDTQFKSPYNTYLVPALPIAPIGNPGRAAMEAVLNPAPGPWLYFVTTNPDTGLTKYATTPSEFAGIKAEFDAWVRANPSR